MSGFSIHGVEAAMRQADYVHQMLADDDGPGLDGTDTAYIVGATILGAASATTAFALFIWRAFIKPSRPRRTP